MSVGAWVVVAAVVLALGFGTYRALTDGRFRGTRRLPHSAVIEAADSSAVEAGDHAAAEAADNSAVDADHAAVDGDQSVVEVRGAPATSLETTPEAARPTPASPPTEWDHVTSALPDAELGEKATLLQFSSAFCAPCRATRRTLGEVADVVPGVTHLEVDAEQHLDLVRHLGILRTPTTLVLDAAGREVTRASGAPRKEQVLAALGTV